MSWSRARRTWIWRARRTRVEAQGTPERTASGATADDSPAAAAAADSRPPRTRRHVRAGRPALTRARHDHSRRRRCLRVIACDLRCTPHVGRSGRGRAPRSAVDASRRPLTTGGLMNDYTSSRLRYVDADKLDTRVLDLDGLDVRNRRDDHIGESKGCSSTASRAVRGTWSSIRAAGSAPAGSCCRSRTRASTRTAARCAWTSTRRPSTGFPRCAAIATRRSRTRSSRAMTRACGARAA